LTITTRLFILKSPRITPQGTDDVKAEEKDEQADDSSAAYCTADDGPNGRSAIVTGVNSVC